MVAAVIRDDRHRPDDRCGGCSETDLRAARSDSRPMDRCRVPGWMPAGRQFAVAGRSHRLRRIRLYRERRGHLVALVPVCGSRYATATFWRDSKIEFARRWIPG